MADQTVRISNLPDSGSSARVGYDLWLILRGKLPSQQDGKAHIKAMLDLYAECRDAANGARNYEVTS